MIININSLLEKENQIARNNQRKYKNLIDNTDKIIRLLPEIVEINNRKAAVFYFLFNQVHNGLNLSLLSILRRHEVQSQFVLRHTIETSCLAVYSLHNTNKEDFMKNDNIGAKPVKNVEKKSYKWLNENYPRQSERLKLVKDQINGYYAHGNLFNSFKTINNKDGIKMLGFFDKKDKLFEQTLIWKIGYVSCIIFDLVYQASKKSKVVKRNNGIYEKFIPLLEESQIFRQKFMNEKRLNQWINCSME